MKKDKNRKLSLGKQTLRTLEPPEHQQVAGGTGPAPWSQVHTLCAGGHCGGTGSCGSTCFENMCY